jgi:formate--tetrahydrofolate ligase
VVIVTVRALKLHGGVDKRDLSTPNPTAVRVGLPNLFRHLANIRQFGIPALAAINLFPTDTEDELRVVEEALAADGTPSARSEIHAHGGAGGQAMGEALIRMLEGPRRTPFHMLYPDDMPLRRKIETIATRVYRAAGVDVVGTAPKDLALFEKLGYGHLPVCIAKTQYSFSDNAALLNAPEGFRVTVRSARLSAGRASWWR